MSLLMARDVEKRMVFDFASSSPLKGRHLWGPAALFGLLLLLASPAYGHKVTIFAYAEEGLIKTESRFSGGRPARNCNVTVQSLPDQTLVASGQSDEQGFFAFPLPAKAADLDIIIICGDGHRGSWRLEAQEYLPAEAQPAPHLHESPDQAASLVSGDQEAVLRHIIAEEVEKKVAPLRRDLARLAVQKTSVADILGGIGYILGLAGLASYMKYKGVGKS